MKHPWLFLVLLASPAAAQDVGAEIGIVTRYVWRGRPLTNALSVQPAVTVSWGAFSAGIWNNITRRVLTETDVWAEVGNDALALGWITYDGAASELYGHAALGPVRFYAAYDLDGAGWYVQPGIAGAWRGFDLTCGAGFGQDLQHIECGAARTVTIGPLSLTPSVAWRHGLLWGGVTIDWPSHKEQE